MPTARASRRPSAPSLRVLLSEIATVHLDGGPFLEELLPSLRRLFRADGALAFGVVAGARELAFLHTRGLPQQPVRQSLLRFLAGESAAGLLFDPRLPQLAQRNVALRLDDLATLTRQPPPSLEGAFPGCRLEGADQLRVLVCDGENLLAVIALFRSHAFARREQRQLQQLVQPLRERLLLQERLRQSPLYGAALQSVLESIPQAAYIVGGGSGVVACNAAGKEARDADPSGMSATLQAAVAGSRPGFLVTPISAGTLGPWHLVITESLSGTEQLLTRRIAEWELTRRQGDVLQRVAGGRTNKAVAEELGCALKTVEQHMSSILAKARCRSRAELLVRVLCANSATATVMTFGPSMRF